MTASDGSRALTARERLAAALGRLYPFYSGCGMVANHPWVRRFVGDAGGHVWTQLASGRLLCPMDDHVGRSVVYMGDLDRKVSWACRKLVRPGDTALDVGANIGMLSLFLSDIVGQRGCVHAFEPNPRTYALLLRSISANSPRNIRAHGVALGEAECELTLSIPQGNAGGASLAGLAGQTIDSAVRVPVVPLDIWAQRMAVRKVDFIKMDVEGFEPQVLRGGLEFLRAVRPRAIVFEHNDTRIPCAEHPSFALLSAIGYRFFFLPFRLLRMNACRFDPAKDGRPRSHDFVAVPGELYDELARALHA
ncbi:MAG TPA: FkbM family methyltransferase [Steroidobacteraceae bacterium]|nr:FkbM family methyltransferase [Steroidobacteraceae bacterium]